MIRSFCFAILTASAVVLAGCTTKTGDSLSRSQKAYKSHPIVVKVHSKYIDEDSPLEYTIRFRNSGTEVVSFDYTVADRQGIPHVDREGPNSGLVRNLYPGATLELPNPLKIKRVFVTLGTVTYGKRADADLETAYRPRVSLSTATPEAASPLLPDTGLPQ